MGNITEAEASLVNALGFAQGYDKVTAQRALSEARSRRPPPPSNVNIPASPASSTPRASYIPPVSPPQSSPGFLMGVTPRPAPSAAPNTRPASNPTPPTPARTDPNPTTSPSPAQQTFNSSNPQTTSAARQFGRAASNPSTPSPGPVKNTPGTTPRATSGSQHTGKLASLISQIIIILE